MKNLEIEYILLAFLGVVIHILIHVLNRKNKKIPFSFSYFLMDRENWIRIILSVLSILALLIMSDSLSNIFGVTFRNGYPAKDVFAFIAGYFNHSLISNVLKIFKK
jgi:hypothetical protein